MVPPDKRETAFHYRPQNVSLPDLEAFAVVAQLQSFTETAAILHISQPAVTQRIRRLEHALGCQLVERGSRGAEVTPTGRQFIERLFPALDALRDAVQAVSQQHTNVERELIIASTPFLASVALPRLLRSFLARKEQARVVLQDLSYKEVTDAIKADAAHLAILADVTDESLDAEILGSTDVVIAAPPNHPLAGLEVVSISDLSGMEIYLNHQYFHLFERIEAFAQDQNVENPPNPHLVQGMGTVVGMVDAAMGLALVTRTVAEVFCGPHTSILQIEGMSLTREYSLLRSRRFARDPLMMELVEHIRHGFVGVLDSK